MESSKYNWYILLPKKHTYVGPFSTLEVMKAILAGRLKIDTYVWSPELNQKEWTKAISHQCFQQILKNPKWLFSLSKSELSRIYDLINGVSVCHEDRLSWYEEHNGKRVDFKDKSNFSQTDIKLFSLPKRSKRFEVEQTIAVHCKGNNLLKTSASIISKNGIFLKIKSNPFFSKGKEINLSTKDHINQQVLHLDGIITSRTEGNDGQQLGIRFIKITPAQRGLIDSWVNSFDNQASLEFRS